MRKKKRRCWGHRGEKFVVFPALAIFLSNNNEGRRWCKRAVPGQYTEPSGPVGTQRRTSVSRKHTSVRPSPSSAATTSFPSRPSREPRGYFWGSLRVQDGCTVTDSVASRRMVNNGHRVAGAHWADVWQKKKLYAIFKRPCSFKSPCCYIVVFLNGYWEFTDFLRYFSFLCS